MEKTLDQRIEDLKSEIAKLEEQKALEAEKNNPLAIKTLTGIHEKLGVDPAKDKFTFDGFTEEDNKVIENIVARMRVCKVYNEGKLPAKDERWYPWHTRKSGSASSGLVFADSCCHDGSADLNSASRLSFVSDKASRAYAKNFMDIEEGIIQL